MEQNQDADVAWSAGEGARRADINAAFSMASLWPSAHAVRFLGRAAPLAAGCVQERAAMPSGGLPRCAALVALLTCALPWPQMAIDIKPSRGVARKCRRLLLAVLALALAAAATGAVLQV